MKAPKIRARFSISRLIITFVILALSLAMIKGAYRPRTYGADVELDVVAPADRTESAMKAHAERLVSPAILKAALTDRRLSAHKRFRESNDPEAELRRLVYTSVTDVGRGSLLILAEGDSSEEATAIVSALADAYARDQGPSRVVRPSGQRIGLWSTGSALDLPWHVAVATIGAILASASILFIPSRWLRLDLWLRPIVVRFQESPPRFLLRALLRFAVIPPTLLVLSLLGLFPWSGLNCWTNDIDISSGRIRYTRYLLWIPISRSVRDSALTDALSPEDLAGRPADWHPAVTLSPGLHHSPHYRFHGAIHQIRELEICWESGKMTPAARRASAEQVLRLWRQSGGYFEAGEYIRAIWERALEAERTGERLDEDDLPESPAAR